jgi:hypothetical protein
MTFIMSRALPPGFRAAALSFPVAADVAVDFSTEVDLGDSRFIPLHLDVLQALVVRPKMRRPSFAQGRNGLAPQEE